MKKTELTSILVAILLSVSGAANGQGISNQLSGGAPEYDIVMKNGIDLDTVMDIARQTGIRAQLTETENGDFVLLSYQDTNLILTTFGCDNGTCPALHMMMFINNDGLNPDQFDFSEFNAIRPHGNAVYVAENDQFAVQRVVTAFSGITKGSLAGELGFMIGYSDAFMKWLLEQVSLISVSADKPQTAASKIDNEISLAGTAMVESDVAEVFRLLKKAGVLESDIYSQW